MTGHTPEQLALAYGLTMAAALPPDAMVAPPHAVRPVLHSDDHAILSAAAIASALDRATMEVGRGRAFLGELDRRLSGLGVRFDAFRVTDGPGVLVSIGLVARESESGMEQRATVHDLWLLANAALAKQGIPCEHIVGLGDGAFLALHGGRTAQVAWLVGERLATVTVACLRIDKNWAIDSARSIAALADDRLALEIPEGPPSLAPSGG